MRLQSLLSEEKNRSQGPVFLKIVKKFQDYIGSKTGVMPGEEMKYAYMKSMNENREIYLIDQDIRVTVKRLGRIPRKEKVKAFASLIFAFFGTSKFDIYSIPEEDVINKLLTELEDELPYLHEVLVNERNMIMAKSLQKLQEENPESDIVAFVGAAHRKGILQLLDTE